MAALTTQTGSGLVGGSNAAKQMMTIKLFRNIVVDLPNGEKGTAKAGDIIELPIYMARELMELERATTDLEAEVPLLPYQVEQMEAEKTKKKGKE